MWVYGCSFREDDQACDEEPAYRVRLADCVPCRDLGFPTCSGHRACIAHAADARADDLLFMNNADIVIAQISSLEGSQL